MSCVEDEVVGELKQWLKGATLEKHILSNLGLFNGIMYYIDLKLYKYKVIWCVLTHN